MLFAEALEQGGSLLTHCQARAAQDSTWWERSRAPALYNYAHAHPCCGKGHLGQCKQYQQLLRDVLEPQTLGKNNLRDRGEHTQAWQPLAALGFAFSEAL